MSFEIPISLIRQHLFCPRIPFYYLNYSQREWPKPIWVSQGLQYEKVRIKLLKKKLFSGISNIQNVRFNVPVQSNKFGLTGKLDGLLELPTEIIPFEIKLNSIKPQKSHTLQLAAYALCLQEMGYTVNQGLILTGKRLKRFSVFINEALLKEIKDVIEKIQKSVHNPFPPDSSATPAKCAQCEFYIQCLDRDI